MIERDQAIKKSRRKELTETFKAFFTISFSGIAESHLDNCTEQVRDEAKRNSGLRSGRKRG